MNKPFFKMGLLKEEIFPINWRAYGRSMQELSNKIQV